MIRFAGVGKHFGAVEAVRPTDLAVAQGEFFTLLGPSGSGKTTLLNVTAGYVAPSAGRVFIGDADVTDLPPRRRNVGMVFQSYALFPHLDVFENVAYGLRVRRLPAAEIQRRVAAALATLQLDGLGDRRIAQLSGGQQQRVALARALVIEPSVLLMDEPLGALDRQLRKQVQLELRHLHQRMGRTTLYVTHDQEEALVLSDRIGVMRAGRLEQVGTARELYERPASVFVAGFLGESNLLGGQVARLEGERAELRGAWLAGPDPGRGGAGSPRRSQGDGAGPPRARPARPRRRPTRSTRASRRSSTSGTWWPCACWRPDRRPSGAGASPGMASLRARRSRPASGARTCASCRTDGDHARFQPRHTIRNATATRRFTMITRRRFLGGAAGLALATGLPHPARGQGRPFVFCSWGGALSAMEKEAMVDPAAKKLGVEVTHASPTAYAKIKAMVEAKRPEWDLVDVGGRFIFQGRDQDLVEPIDYKIVDRSLLPAHWYASHGVYTSAGGTVIAYNTARFPEGKGPQSWKDFWDVKTFPGPRGLYKSLYYTYEAAMLGAGVSRTEVYPLTDEKVKLALARLTELKPHVKVWWTAGAQPPQLLASGELAMSSAWNGRILAVMKEKAPVTLTYKDGIAWANAWVVVKGTPYKDVAMKMINEAIAEEAQTRLLPIGVYAPLNLKALAKATPDQRLAMATHPDNVKDMLILDEEAGAQLTWNPKYEEWWNKFQLS